MHFFAVKIFFALFVLVQSLNHINLTYAGPLPPISSWFGKGKSVSEDNSSLQLPTFEKWKKKPVKTLITWNSYCNRAISNWNSVSDVLPLKLVELKDEIAEGEESISVNWLQNHIEKIVNTKDENFLRGFYHFLNDWASYKKEESGDPGVRDLDVRLKWFLEQERDGNNPPIELQQVQPRYLAYQGFNPQLHNPESSTARNQAQRVTRPQLDDTVPQDAEEMDLGYTDWSNP